MKATRFMRKPFIVTGYKVTEDNKVAKTKDNMEAIAKWCEGNVIRDTERPFVRVPVNRYVNKKQTQAYVGNWVILSIQRGERSFKVYTDEWLDKNFIEIPEEIDDEITSEIWPAGDEPVSHSREPSDNVRTLPTHVPSKPVTFRAAT